MSKSTAIVLTEKSKAACIAAVETFNRASSQYREETFAILMINAWELLLKARILQENKNKMNSLHVYEYKKKKDGSRSKISIKKRNKSGSFLTIGIEKSKNILSSYQDNSIDTACCDNIDALLAIRDSSIHFMATNAQLKIVLTGISLAAVKNYVLAAQKWFDMSFSDLNIASIPISFDLDQKEVEAVAKKQPEAVINFLKHIDTKSMEANAINSEYAYTISVDFSIVKKPNDGTVNVAIVNDPNADILVGLDQDQVPNGFTLDYKELTDILKDRYSDFKQSNKYHVIRREFEGDKKLCFSRFLNPNIKTGTVKKFYSPNILKNFDDHYTKKQPALL